MSDRVLCDGEIEYLGNDKTRGSIVHYTSMLPAFITAFVLGLLIDHML